MKKRGKGSSNIVKRKQKEPLYLHYVGTKYIRPNGTLTRVFDTASYNFCRAIEIYESMLEKGATYGTKRYSQM